MGGASHVGYGSRLEDVEAELVLGGEEAADVTNRDACLARSSSGPAGTDDDLLEGYRITPR